MKKFIAGLIAGVSVIALTLIAVLLSPETFLQIRWRITSISLGICAVISMLLQGIWTMHDEEAQTQERKQLYNLITEVVATAGDARIGSDETVENTRRAEKLLGELESTRPKSEPLWAMPGSTAGEEEKMGRKGPRGDKFRELQWLLTKLITGRKEF